DRIYVATGPAVAVLDGASNSVVATVPVSSVVGHLGVNATTNRIYAVNGPAVSVIDGESNSVIDTFSPGGPTGSSPGDVAVNASTNRVYVTNSCGVTQCNLTGVLSVI